MLVKMSQVEIKLSRRRRNADPRSQLISSRGGWRQRMRGVVSKRSRSSSTFPFDCQSSSWPLFHDTIFVGFQNFSCYDGLYVDQLKNKVLPWKHGQARLQTTLANLSASPPAARHAVDSNPCTSSRQAIFSVCMPSLSYSIPFQHSSVDLSVHRAAVF